MSAQHTSAMREKAVRFAMSVIIRSSDWQDVQHALADHDEFGPWLDREYSDDVLSVVQAIIREAESRSGGKLPAEYG